MITTTKWYELKIDSTIQGLYSKLLENSYKHHAELGFEIIEYLGESIRAKFIERKIVREIIIDPFGDESYLESIRYTMFSFNIINFRSDSYLLCIESPPRSIKSFVNYLFYMFGFGHSIKPALLNLSEFVQTIKSSWKPTNIRITKINVNKLVLGEYSYATLTVNSSTNAYHDFVENFGNHDFSIEKIKVMLRVDGVDGFVELSRNGCASFSDHYKSTILTIVKNLII